MYLPFPATITPGASVRIQPNRVFGAVGFATALCVATPALAAQREWTGAFSEFWTSSQNWTAFDIPDSDDTAVIGNAPNNDVLLNTDTNPIDGLTLTDGATLNTNGRRLVVDNATDDAPLNIGDGSTLFVSTVNANPAASGLDTDRLNVLSGGTFGNIDLSVIDDRLQVFQGGTVASVGTIVIGQGINPGNIGLINDGTITASLLGAGTLTLQSEDNKTFDLDGSFGDGVIRAAADGLFGGVAASTLNINGALSDNFDGTAVIGQRDAMNFQQAWVNSGQLEFNGTDADPATLGGAEMTLDDNTAGDGGSVGDGWVTVNSGTAVVDADVFATGGTWTMADNTTTTFNGEANFLPAADLDLSAASLTVNVNDSLRVQQSSIDLDGTVSADNTINVNSGATLRIDGDFSDAFNGTLNLENGSTLTLNGVSTFAADSTFDKTSGNITVNIGGQTTINTTIDLDGVGAPLSTINLTNDTASLTLNGDIENNGAQFDGTINNRGALTVAPGTVWTNDGTIHLIDEGIDPTVGGNGMTNTGVLRGDGTFNVTVNNAEGGLIQPGTASTAGRLDFNNPLTMGDESEMEIGLGGVTPGTGHDRIDATTLNLEAGSTLDVDSLGGYLPTLYTTHTVVDATLMTGVFNFIDGVVIAATDTGWAVTYDYALDQVLVQRALLGDANLNGQVEQGDLDAVLQNWGGQASDGVISWVTGDLNGNGQVEQGDLDAILQNWGSLAAPDFTGSPVPEPAVGLLAAMLATLRRRSASRAATFG